MGNNNKLFFKISLALLGVLIALGLSYVFISGYISNRYLREVNQKLYGDIAESTVKEVQPLVDGEVDTLAIQKIMHGMMLVNPNVEVYLLDTVGSIITYVAPYQKVVLDKVNMAPIHQFIAEKGEMYIEGDDPRHLDKCNVFSVAPLIKDDKLEGYVYIILAGEEQAAVTSSLFGSYMARYGANIFFISLIGALLIGTLAIYLLTRNLSRITDTVIRFKEGDYEARIPEDQKGDFVPLANTFNDMADTINANIEEIKSVERLRRELIANVSHDLRTPLAIMQGYVETLIMKEDTISKEDRVKHLNTVLSSSKRLSKLVGQLFEYSKLEAKQIQPQKEPFFMSELAQDVLAKYKILAEKRNIQLALDRQGELPMVFADVSLVERVIQNLMDNALKFTPDNGKIALELSETNSGIEVKVSDSGPGIPEDQQAHIFERYFKAKNNEHKSSGAGLGLAIVKKILEIHDSTISVSSRPNQGATFAFFLPSYQGA